MEKAKAQLGDEALANQFQQQSVQERVALATEKLKEVFIQIAEPVLAIVEPLMNLVGSVLPLINILLQPLIVGFQVMAEGVNYIVNSVTGLYGMLTGSNEQLTVMQKIVGAIAGTYLIIKGLQIGLNVLAGIRLGITAQQGLLEQKSLFTANKGIAKSVGMAVFNIIGSFAKLAPPVGLILGLVAAAGVAAMAAKYMNDGIISPKSGGSGYGDRVMYGPEGAISFNNKDTIVAGTDLFKKGDDVMSAPKNTLKVSNQTSPSPKPPDTNTQLLDEMKKQNYLREQSNRQNKTVSTLRIQ